MGVQDGYIGWRSLRSSAKISSEDCSGPKGGNPGVGEPCAGVCRLRKKARGAAGVQPSRACGGSPEGWITYRGRRQCLRGDVGLAPHSRSSASWVFFSHAHAWVQQALGLGEPPPPPGAPPLPPPVSGSGSWRVVASFFSGQTTPSHGGCLFRCLTPSPLGCSGYSTKPGPCVTFYELFKCHLQLLCLAAMYCLGHRWGSRVFVSRGGVDRALRPDPPPPPKRAQLTGPPKS